MSEPKNIIEIQHRSATLEPEDTPEGEPERKNVRKVRMVSEEGRIVRRYGYDPDSERYGEYDEELVLSGADLSRIDADQVSFLDSHRAGSVANVIGRLLPGSGRVVDDGVEAEVELDEADERAQKILRGFARNVSVGFEYVSSERVKRSGDVPLVRVTGWRLRELSAVSVGADFGAAFRCRGLFDDGGADVPIQGAEKMELTAGQTLEAVKYGRSLGVDADKAEAAIGAAPTMEAALRAMLDLRATEQKQTPGPGLAGRIEAGADAADKGLALLKSRMYARLAAGGMPVGKDAAGKLVELDTRFSDCSLVQILAAHARLQGRAIPDHMSRREILEVALGTRADGPHTTSDFTSVLADITNNSVAAAMGMSPSTFEQWCAPTLFPDFREIHISRLSEDGGPRPVKEGATVTRGTIGDEHERASAIKYGREYALTLEAIINDSLSAFEQLPAFFTQRWTAAKNQIAYELLRSNPLMTDGFAFFSTEHANLVATPSPAAPSAAQLEAMRYLLVSQTNKKGEKVRSQPTRYLAPEALSVQFARLLGNTIQVISPIDTTSAALAVPQNLNLPVTHEIELDAAPDGYYCVGPVSDMPGVHGRVAGYGLRVMTEWDYKEEVLVTRIQDSYGVDLINWRSFVFNPGA